MNNSIKIVSKLVIFSANVRRDFGDIFIKKGSTQALDYTQ